jgi:hypothetical protein
MWRKCVVGIAIAWTAVLATSPATAFRVTTEGEKWPDRVTHHIPQWETHCLHEVFRSEGLETELLTFGIKADDPQVLALRRYCETRQSVIRNLPGLWPAAGQKLGRVAASRNKTSRHRHLGNHHHGRHKHRAIISKHILPEWRSSEQAPRALEAMAQEIADAMHAARGGTTPPRE